MSVISFGDIPSFYYINPITSLNYFMDFDEGTGELTAEIPSGDYTMTGLATAIQDALNGATANAFVYTVEFLRDERKFKITCDNVVSLLVSTGSHVGNDVYSLIGFTGADLTGLLTYTGNNQAGSEYIAQFPLQDYVDQEDFQKSVSASINKSANGLVEVVSFGTEKFFDFNIMFATNIDVGNHGPIRKNLTGVSDLRLFMRFCITKKSLEFMPDYNDKDTFYNVLLEKSEEDSNGTGYRLKEMYTKGLPGYFETGVLRFKLIE